MEKLQVSIGISNSKNFDWDTLRQKLESAFKGQISGHKRRDGIHSFNWEGMDSDLVVSAAKDGSFDQIINSLANGLLIDLVAEKECTYQIIPEKKLKEPKIKSVDLNTINSIRHHAKILIITVNEREHKAVLNFLKPWPREKNLLQGAITKHTYLFGKFGNYHAAYVETQMGTNETSGINNILDCCVLSN